MVFVRCFLEDFLWIGWKPVGLLLTVAALTGCSGTTTFTAYPTKINPFIANVECGNPVDLETCLISETESNDKVLYTMERARLEQIFQKTDASLADFEAAIEKIREDDQKAIVSASKIGANIASAAVNDNAIPYEARGYERVMLRHYQAMNYLSKGDLEGAGVEIRNANMEQEESLKRHQKEIEEAQKDAEEKNLSSVLENEELMGKYAAMDLLSGKVKNSFQNAYTFYLSGLIYEIEGQENDAYIDYKKALEIYPDNKYLQNDVIRLAKCLEMNGDLAYFQEHYNIDATVPDEDKKGKGEVIILFEDGFVPQKHEVKIPLPIPKAGLIAIAFPIYKAEAVDAIPLVLKDEDKEIGCTDPICDLGALAVKSLKEEIPSIATRQLARAITKGATTALVKEELGQLGSLTMSLWNWVSESADLRSWITLPSNAQILRTTLPAGSHKLTLEHSRLTAPAVIDVDVNEKGKTIVHVVSAGTQLYSAVHRF